MALKRKQAPPPRFDKDDRTEGRRRRNPMQEAVLYFFHDSPVYLCFANNHDASAQLEHRGRVLRARNRPRCTTSWPPCVARRACSRGFQFARPAIQVENRDTAFALYFLYPHTPDVRGAAGHGRGFRTSAHCTHLLPASPFLYRCGPARAAPMGCRRLIRRRLVTSQS